MRSLTVEEYETVHAAFRTHRAHWDLAEWCQQHLCLRERKSPRRVTNFLEHQAQMALGRVWREGGLTATADGLAGLRPVPEQIHHTSRTGNHSEHG